MSTSAGDIDAQRADARRKEFLKGTTIALIGVVVFSFDAFLIRTSGVAGFLASFWRGLFTGLALGILFLFSNRLKSLEVLKAGGRPLVLSGVLWGLSGICFTSGVQHAGAANTLLLLSLAPIFTAVYEVVRYRIRPSRVTILASCIAIGGIAYIYHDGLRDVPLSAMSLAAMTPVLFGINLSNLQRNKQISRIAVCMLGGFSGAALSLIIVRGVITIQTTALLPLAVLGLFVIPFGQTMISTGTRYISAVETALIQSTETVLGVLYVWVLLEEAPGDDFMVGGVIVLLAIIYNAVFHARRL
jgi:drug/metabolite transporter (DMT)-like permease